MQQFIFTFPNDTDIKNVAEIQIYNGFILTLPFRLRTGTFFSVNVNTSFDVIFRNRLDIPSGTSLDKVLKLMRADKKSRLYEQFFTEVLILEKQSVMTESDRKRIIAYLENPGDHKLPDTNAQYYQALSCLNDVIVGYHHATNCLFGGAVVGRLTPTIFFDRLRYLHTIFCPANYELSQADFVELLDARGKIEFTQLEGLFATDQLDDVPNDRLESIQQYIQLHQRFLFYQFALDAKSKMVEQDLISAILFVVVALEGVLSTLLQMRFNYLMKSSIPNPDTRAKQAETKANRLLKDVGFSESIEMVSLLFLDAEDRPTDDLMQKCKLGITIRNEIMHTSVKKGQYRLRNRTNQQISEAYSNVLKMFNHLAIIVVRDTISENMA